MGNQQYHQHRRQPNYNQWDGRQLERLTGLNSGQIQQLYQEFIRIAGSDGLIGRNEFGQLYGQLNVGPYDATNIERAFRTFDRDRSGFLSFDEFLSAAVMLNNNNNINARERVTYLIDSNNPNGMNQNFITPDYGRQIIQNMNQFYGTNANFDDIWGGLNANNGQVSRDDFVSYISQTPAFVQYFYV